MIGGKQTIMIGSNCEPKEIRHELLHTVGLHHTHNRKDRDENIEIFWKHMTTTAQKNFKICYECYTYGMPYDPKDILHYPVYSKMSKNGLGIFKSKHSLKDSDFGSNEDLSQANVNMIKMMYTCDQPCEFLLPIAYVYFKVFLYLGKSSEKRQKIIDEQQKLDHLIQEAYIKTWAYVETLGQCSNDWETKKVTTKNELLQKLPEITKSFHNLAL